MKTASSKEPASIARKKPERPASGPSLRLYVAGSTPNSQRARANLEAILKRTCEECDVEIVDVLVDPRRAIADNILVTPTLLSLGGGKSSVLIGDLSDTTTLEIFVAHLGAR